MLRQLDLCSGVGAGFPLAGIKLEEFELVGLCEIDSWCQGILSTRFPEVPIYSDVRRLPRLTNIDIITASPPCQPLSRSTHLGTT